jgi:hypothetical protein
MNSKLARISAIVGTAGAALAATAALGAAPASASTFSSAAPARSVNAAATSNIAVRPNVVGFPCGEDYTVTGTYVNIRASYGTSSRILGVAQRGDDFIATYRTSYTYNGFYWAYGEAFNASGSVIAIGYMATAYLHDNGSAGCTYLS